MNTSMDALSPREREVALAYHRGMKTSDIAESMGVKPQTVRAYKEQVFLKMQVKTTAEMAVAIERALAQEVSR
jgi:DNA-binding NarL/FixJ family response regulator